MIRQLARWLSGIGIHWFYSDIQVLGSERIPLRGPILVAMNHQNALVDAMLAQWIVPRELKLTAKATLGESVPGALLMKVAGIIPLSRSSDTPTSSDPVRNRHSFQAIIENLRIGGAVLVFPEGKSHNNLVIAPLKSGLARAALRAREDGVKGIQIVPIGITFENKAEPGTAVLAQVGEPIAIDEWPGDNARELTNVVASRLGAVALTGMISRHTHLPGERNVLDRVFSWWGQTMHELPLRIARRAALRQSTDQDEPAMYTMTFGLAAILVSYLIEVPIVEILFGWITALTFLASLIMGAYWWAYSNHPPRGKA
jgi:1-acyl-sn-glycerol-3-phosphate acyltransferase